MLVNPSNLYSGGNVRLDPTPYLRMAMHQRYRRQALDEASTQYFTKLAEKLNPDGARPQDMQDPEGNGGIQKDIDDWQTKWNVNKDAIKKGGIAQQEFMSDFARIRQRIGESKNRIKTQVTLGKYATTPNGWKPRDDDTPIIGAIDLSIYNPKSKKEDGVTEYGLNDLSLSAAPYTPQYELKHNKVITSNIQPDKLPDDVGVFDPVAKTVTYNHGYTPEKVQAIVQTGLATLASDRTMKYHYQDLLKEPEMVELASTILQEDYDKTHTDGQKVIVDTPEEMYAGLKMAEFQTAKIPKTYTDKASIDEYNKNEWNRRFGITNRARIKAAALHNARVNERMDKILAGTEEVGYPLDDVVNDLAIEHEIKAADGSSLGTQQRVYKKDIPVGEMEIYSPKEARVRGYKDIATGEEYYLPTTDAKGHYQLVGEGGKIIGAEVARQNKVNKVIPANKVKQGIYFNKGQKQTSKPKKDPLGIF